MKKMGTKKTMILAAVGLLFVLDGALAYYNAKLSKQDENPEQLLKLRTRDLSLMKADVERAEKIKADMPAVQKYFGQFEGTLPPPGKGYSVISQEFDEISRETRVQVEGLKFRQSDVKGRDVDKLEVQATLSGDYPGIVRFLNRLQRSKNLYIVDELGLDSVTSTGPSAASPGMVKVELHLRSYFRKA
ncbi:MAG TPA: GspMb/PilO family protein [Candidatus Eisenbacteria bacterium]|nr:GspMb/PilO family protein [Candidatus Eisenbacteria bacterium]